VVEIREVNGIIRNLSSAASAGPGSEWTLMLYVLAKANSLVPPSKAVSSSTTHRISPSDN
jgi:hypothetical protein